MRRSITRPLSSRYLSSLLLFAALAVPSAMPRAQSFDCRAAYYADEKTICENPGLAALDQELATSYRRNAAQLDQEQRDAFHRNEIDFVKARRRCADNRHCLAQSYRNRIQELQALLSQGDDDGGNVGRRTEDKSAERRAPPRDNVQPETGQDGIRQTDNRQSVPRRAPEPDRPGIAALRPPEPEDRAATIVRIPEPNNRSTAAVRTPEPDSRPSAAIRPPERHETTGSTSAERPIESPSAGSMKDEASESVKTKSREPRHHKTRTAAKSQPAAASTPAAAPSETPTIQWANPPPTH